MSKIESNHIELNLSSGTVKQCLHDVMISMQVQLDQKSKAYGYTAAGCSRTSCPSGQDAYQQIFLIYYPTQLSSQEKAEMCMSPSVRTARQTVLQVILLMRDTGIGIEEEAQKRIFEPSEQAGPQTRGVGPGLTDCWNLLQLMGGSISVESVFGSGTTFHVQVSFRLSDTESAKSRKTENERL